MSKQFISVTILTSYIKSSLASEELLQNVKLAGEVSGIRCSGPHAYFTLKDVNSQIDCTCFSYSKTYLPKSGESVILTGGVDFYAKGGKLSFIARAIEPLGQGELALRLEKLKQKLILGGFFDEKHKKDIPDYPERVCVVTAKTGAVIRDIVSTVRQKNKLIDIDVYDVKVQGFNAAGSIISALDVVDKLGYDVIIIARGGGSLEDLMAFNDEGLVYKIFDMNTPVISAVGHETDYTLCDFACDLRVPTPTGAGEIVGYDVAEVKARVLATASMCGANLIRRIDSARVSLTQSVFRLSASSNLVILNNRNKIMQITTSMSSSMTIKLNDGGHRVTSLVQRLDSNNPTKILAQGYTKLYNSKGLAVGAKDINVGEDITILADGGRIGAVVSSIQLIGDVSNGEV